MNEDIVGTAGETLRPYRLEGTTRSGQRHAFVLEPLGRSGPSRHARFAFCGIVPKTFVIVVKQCNVVSRFAEDEDGAQRLQLESAQGMGAGGNSMAKSRRVCQRL